MSIAALPVDSGASPVADQASIGAGRMLGALIGEVAALDAMDMDLETKRKFFRTNAATVFNL